MTLVAFLSFGFAEILLVGVVALLVFGGDLPDVMRSLGRSYARLRRSLHDLSRPVRAEMNRLRDLPDAPPPPVGPPSPNPPVPEYPDYEEESGLPEAPAEEASPHEPPASGGVADEPPPV